MTKSREQAPAVAQEPLWRERYEGGSPEAERVLFTQLAHAVMGIQGKARARASAHGVPHATDRAFHAKSTLAVDDARLQFIDDLPDDLRAGFAQPGAEYTTTVRFSNASGTDAPDHAPDLRGVALRVDAGDGVVHDLLATNYPVSHARNARQFVVFADATAGEGVSRAVGVARLAATFGPAEAVRMIRNVTTARRHKPGSVATETYWSRGAMRWGPLLAVRFLLRPAPGTAPAPPPSEVDPSYLSREVATRLEVGDVHFELCIQRFVDEERTPIEDTAVEWTEEVAPAEPVAILTIPQRDAASLDAQACVSLVDSLAFNPWNTTDEFRPLGNLNRARKSAYDASASNRAQTSWRSDLPLRNVVLGGAARIMFSAINRRVEWHRLPVHLAVLNLNGYRHVLRKSNLFDTEPGEAAPQARPVPPDAPELARVTRTLDGTHNDLSSPKMGAVGATFGRNLQPKPRPDLDGEPNPVTVSDELLARKQFIPAKSLNLLAAAWIQFQVHDWVNHARNPLGTNDVKVVMPGDRRWVNTVGGTPEREMRIAGNVSTGTSPDGTDLLFANAASHWWDGSEVYGTEGAERLREGPKLRLTEDGYLPTDSSGMEITGFNESWWLGLSGLHTLFAREHNAVCDELRSSYKGWSDDQVFNTARLIVSALIAKIHTVEWTPAILGTVPIDLGLKANWSGPPSNDWITKLGVWLLDVHAATGIPATKPDHHGVPYSLTEDFATVYRMHPLIPDDYRFVDFRTGEVTGKRTFLDIAGAKADDELRGLGLENLLYSFGTSHPGAIALHNYPDALRAFERDGERIDMAVVDLMRTRRRGVPRYNDFREGLHRPRIKHWEQLTDDPDSVAQLRSIYRSIDEVDTMVGLFAEAPPEGFGFSDTAFRIFILMASRRIQSDRFLTVDFRPEIYSPLGMDWVQENSMKSVILRHCPDVATLLPREQSAFAPWRTAVPGVTT